MTNSKNNIFSILGLIALATIVYLPFVYDQSFGDLDSYRMAIGLADAVSTGKTFKEAALYGKGISFAYCAILLMFRPFFENNLTSIITIINYFNVITSILMVVPFFFFVKKYWELSTAIIANSLLIFQPAWWNMALYGNPMIQAVFFLFSGLVLLGNREDFVIGGGDGIKMILLDVATTLFFTFSLMFRLDSILMFPLITGVLFRKGNSIKKAFLKSFGYASVALVLFIIGKALLLGTNSAGNSGASILTMLQTWHHPYRFFSSYIKFTSIFFLSCHPLFLLGFCITCVQLFFKHDYKSLFLIVPITTINIFFWLPNPLPSRHWIYLSPILAIGCAITLKHLAELQIFKKANWTVVTKSIIATTVFVFSTFVFSECIYPIVRQNYPWKCQEQNYSYRAPIRSIFINKYYSERYFQNASKLALDLLALPPQEIPIIVIAERLTTILKMKFLSKNTKIFPINKLTRSNEVVTSRNKFIIIPFWGNFFDTFIKTTGVHGKYYLLLDNYNPLTKCFKPFQKSSQSTKNKPRIELLQMQPFLKNNLD